MADARVKIAKDKAELVKSLRAEADDTTKPFQTYADVLVFAAALGAKRDRREPFTEFSKKTQILFPMRFSGNVKEINWACK